MDLTAAAAIDPYMGKYQNNQRSLQAVLVHNTNIALLQIRTKELNYYSSFYWTFGGQATLIGGFLYSGINQIHFPDNVQYSTELYSYLQMAFWISSSICLGACMHCIIVSIFVQVLGPGMALHGPVGSMAKAALGMRKEVMSTFYAYVIMMVTLAFSAISSVWVLMDFKASVICTGLFIFSMLIWWQYCLRIYNRFFVRPVADADETDMQFEDSDSQSSTNGRQYSRAFSKTSSVGFGRGNSGLDDSLVAERPEAYSKLNDNYRPQVPRSGGSVLGALLSRSRSLPVSDNNKHSRNTRQQSEDQLGTYFRYGKKEKYLLRESDTASVNSEYTGRRPSTSRTDVSSDLSRPLLESPIDETRELDWDPELIVCEGYLTKKGAKSGFLGESWKSRYFALRVDGSLFYYENQQAFRYDPKNALKDRPIDISMYKVKGIKNEDDMGNTTYLIKLVPRSDDRGRVWEMKCDFEDDYERWLRVLRRKR